MPRFDYVGFGLLALGVGALQVTLDKGQEDDWFGSRFITTLIILAAVGLVSLIIWEWRQKEPIVDVRLFKMFNFASCNVMMFVLGVVLFSSTVLLPQFLQTLMGYTAQTAGMVLSMAAIALVFLLPLVGRIAGYIPSAVHTCFRLDHAGYGDVLLVQTHRSSHQLSSRRMVARLAVPAGRILIRPAYDGRLCRYARGKKQRRCRFDQLHAQHRAERRNLGCDYVDCAPKSIPSVRPGRIHAVSSL